MNCIIIQCCAERTRVCVCVAQFPSTFDASFPCTFALSHEAPISLVAMSKAIWLITPFAPC